MKRHFAFTVIMLGILAGSLSAVKAQSKEWLPEEDVNTVVVGNSGFALDLYAKLRDEPAVKEAGGNLFFSPYSISTALAMTYAGARGETEKQMAKTLHFSLPQERLHPAFGTLEKQLNAAGKKGNYELSVANALWGQKGYGFLKPFLELTEKNYGAGLKEVDFVRQTEKVRKTINAWVEEKTKDKIKELIKPGVLGALTRLVLTNAIYFKGDWASKFEEKNTKPAPFHISKERSEEAAMMYQKEEFKYAQKEKLQILELPYKGEELSMVVLLPEEVDGLAELESSLTPERLAEWTKRLHKREVMVYLPKFKMTSKFGMAEMLAAMGMPDAFSGAVDFSGMNGKRDLFISAVIHKAFVEVNEEGTEAAAATGVVMKLTAVPAPPPVFRADHPFIFVIKDNNSGSILFMGRVSNPAKQGK